MPENLSWRQDQAERRLDRLEQRTEDLGVQRQEIANLWRAINELKDEVTSLRRSLITAAVTFGVSSIIVAVSIFRGFS